MISVVSLTQLNRRTTTSLLLLLFISFFCSRIFSIGWTDSLFKSQKAFIENKGQFAGRNVLLGSEIMYVVNDEAEILFTKQGLTYRFDKIEKETFENEKEAERKTKTAFVHLEWLNANTDVAIEAEDEFKNYWNYIDLENKTSSTYKIKGYKKLIYKNLYPNIDVEYVFHPTTGIKYALILHPGADISQVKMKYSGAKKIMKEGNGSIAVLTNDVEIIDYAPLTFYESTKQEIHSSFQLTNDVVSFHLENYDRSKTVVVDPWTVTGFTNGGNALAAHEISSDAANNAYLLLKRIGNGTGYVQKYDAAGALLWTTTIAGGTWFDSGDIIAEPAGNVYVTNGTGTQPSATVKLNTAGAIVWNNRPSANFDEVSRITFNCDYTKLTIAGANRPCCGVGRVADIDPLTGVESNTTLPPHVGDIVSTCFAPNGYFYAIGTESNGIFPPFPTEIICLDPASNYATIFNIPAQFVRKELIPSQTYGCAVINGIAADCNYLYTYNGDTLKKRNLLTGAILAAITIPGGADLTNSGLKLDKCGNIYVGSSTGVYVYDTAFALVNTFVTTAEVSDIVIANNGIFYACGGGTTIANSFITQFSNQVICQSGITVAITPTPCGAQTGTATANPAFCSAPYTYTWLTNPVQNTQTATGLGAGTYSVIVTGSGACSSADTAIAVVTAIGGSVTISVTSTPSLCSSNNGTATATVTSGTPNYSYTWSPSGGAANAATGLSPGTYTVTIIDGIGCSGTATVTVGQTLSALTTTTNTTPSLCNSNNGIATVTASGGTPGYIYAWSPSGGTGTTASNLVPGTYIITVTDTNGCDKKDTVIVLQTSGTLVATTITTPSICTSNNGTATVTASGGTPNYTYAWTPSGGAGTTASNLTPGTYTVSVSDASGCTYTVTASVAQSNGTLTATIVSTPALCTSNNGTATVTPSGGTPNYTYAWSPSGGGGALALGLAGGTYTVIVSDASGCTYSTSTTVTTNNGNVTATATSTPALCNATNGTASVTAGGGNPAYTYLWSPSGGTNSIANGLAPGIYTVIVTDINGCSQTANVLVNNIPGPTVGVSPDITIGLGDSVNLLATGGGTYNWFPSSNLSCTNCANPIAKPNQTTIYCVEVTDANGCRDTACITVMVEIPCPSLQDLSIVPNAFSPNRDGINEEFCLQGWDACLEDFQVVIFDRWGEKIFESKDPNFCWDGTYRNKAMDAQVFVYYIEATFSNSNDKIKKTGNISLIR